MKKREEFSVTRRSRRSAKSFFNAKTAKIAKKREEFFKREDREEARGVFCNAKVAKS